jgi:hypothetical protein
MRGYREFLASYAGWLGLPSGAGEAALVEAALVEAALVEARTARIADSRPDGYLRTLLDDAGVGALLVDTGFGGPGTLRPTELAALVGRPVRTIVRIETTVEGVLLAHGAGRFRDEVRAALVAALDDGAIGFKSIAAYRSGLALERPSERALRRALGDASGQARRLTDRALVSEAVWIAADLAVERMVPLQFHVGFGDRDVHLPSADPTLLRSLLADPAVESAPIVLLHCHPFVAQAAYLASIYPQVHVDLSLTIPLLGEAGARSAISAALALCPASKLLAASDGHSYPEMHWRGARLWREALTEVLARDVEAGTLDASTAVADGSAILGGNAARLYELNGARD